VYHVAAVGSINSSVVLLIATHHIIIIN